MKNYLKISIFIYLLVYLNISFLKAIEIEEFKTRKVVTLAQEIQKLDKKIIKRMRFELLEGQLLKGSTEKYLLKSNSGDVWLFKTYDSSESERVKISRLVYLMASLLGVSTPVVYEINLPINGKLIYGSIQKFIPTAVQVGKVQLNNLSDMQIQDIQNHHIFDWLISNTETTDDHFIINSTANRIIGIDKDSSFKKMDPGFCKKNICIKSFYVHFWGDYVKGEIEVYFKKALDFIDYIQNVDNREFRKILSLFLDESEIIDEFLLRKNYLRSNFKKFYHKLSVLRGEQLPIPLEGGGKQYSDLVLKRIKKNILRKKQELKNLENKLITKQGNIIVISSKNAWAIIKELEDYSRKDFSRCIKKILRKLKHLKKNTSNIHEELAIELYIEEVKRLWQKNSIENFMQEKEIERITMSPERITLKKILNIEYNLRISYGETRKSFAKNKRELAKDNKNILLHLNYINYPMPSNKEKKRIIKEYQQKIKKDEENKINKFIYKLVQRDKKYLIKIDDSFTWKYLGLALVRRFGKHKNEAIGYCNKVLVLVKDDFVVYLSYMLLGALYERNEQWERFGEGFEIEKSIMAYKNAITMKPESVEAYLNLGILYLIKKEPQNALNEFKKVNMLNFKYGKKHFHFDEIKERDSYENKKEYLEAIRMNTLSGRHHYVLGLAYLVNNDNKLAEQHFYKAGEFGYKVDIKL